MIDKNQIKPHMSVVCKTDDNAVIGKVDHIEGDEIKLARDESGQHHYIPASWIAKIDDKLHLDRAGKDAMAQWKTAPSAGAKA